MADTKKSINQHTKRAFSWDTNILVQPQSGAGSSPTDGEHFKVDLGEMEELLVKRSDIMNNLITEEPGGVLDARQGRVLKEQTDATEGEVINARRSGFLSTTYESLGGRLDAIDRQIATFASLDPNKYWGLFYYEDDGTFERTGRAAGLTAARHNGAYDPYLHNDFDFEAPWAGIKHLKVNADGELLAYKGQPQYETSDGEWLGRIPRIYSGTFYDTKNGRPGVHHIVSMLPLNGLVANGFYGADGELLDEVFVGRVPIGDGFVTKPGIPIKVNTSMTSFMSNLQNKSNKVDWYLQDHAVWYTLVQLMIIEFGGYNVKSLIGQGVNSGMPYGGSYTLLADVVDGNDVIVNFSSAYHVGMLVQVGTGHTSQNRAANRYIEAITDNGDNTITLTLSGEPFDAEIGNTCCAWWQPVSTDLIDALGYGSGWIKRFDSETRSNVCYRGFWDLWGNVWQWLAGILRNDLQIWLSYNRSKNNIVSKAGIESDSDWFYSGVSPNLPNGYQKFRIPHHWEKGISYLPLETGGGAGSGSWLAAYLYWFNDSYMSIRAVLVGGGWYNGANVSPFYWNGNNSPGNSNINIGGRCEIVGSNARRLSCKALVSLPKGEIAQKTSRLVVERIRKLISANNDPIVYEGAFL